jgi:hypothetical protein
MQENGLDLRAIDPRNGEKYSLNLYQWLTKRDDKMRAWASRVYRDANGSLFVGWPSESHPGEFIGARMGDILCYGRRSECFCFLSLVLEEIPNFWERYTAIGRCAIDDAHTMSFLGAENRWKQTGDTRECQWCGAQQHLERWTETVEREAWRAAP